jgi:hypothetical protein
MKVVATRHDAFPELAMNRMSWTRQKLRPLGGRESTPRPGQYLKSLKINMNRRRPSSGPTPRYNTGTRPTPSPKNPRRGSIMDMLQAINRKLSGERFDAGAAQILMDGIALLIMVVGIRKMAAMQLTEAQLVFGILLVLILTMQAVIMGTLVGLRAKKSLV